MEARAPLQAGRSLPHWHARPPAGAVTLTFQDAPCRPTSRFVAPGHDTKLEPGRAVHVSRSTLRYSPSPSSVTRCHSSAPARGRRVTSFGVMIAERRFGLQGMLFTGSRSPAAEGISSNSAVSSRSRDQPGRSSSDADRRITRSGRAEPACRLRRPTRSIRVARDRRLGRGSSRSRLRHGRGWSRRHDCLQGRRGLLRRSARSLADHAERRAQHCLDPTRVDLQALPLFVGLPSNRPCLAMRLEEDRLGLAAGPLADVARSLLGHDRRWVSRPSR